MDAPWTIDAPCMLYTTLNAALLFVRNHMAAPHAIIYITFSPCLHTVTRACRPAHAPWSCGMWHAGPQKWKLFVPFRHCSCFLIVLNQSCELTLASTSTSRLGATATVCLCICSVPPACSYLLFYDIVYLLLTLARNSVGSSLSGIYS
jgi:hypothetical protein